MNIWLFFVVDNFILTCVTVVATETVQVSGYTIDFFYCVTWWSSGNIGDASTILDKKVVGTKSVDWMIWQQINFSFLNDSVFWINQLSQ